MKKQLFFGLSILFCLLSCHEVTTVVVQPTVLQMVVNDIKTINATVSPVATLEWASSDDSVATVFHGAITATGIGTAVITASANGVSASCQVYVTGKDGATLALSPAVVSMVNGTTYQLRYSNVYNLPLTWTSSDENVATVNETGMVTAKKAGNTTITLTNGSETVSIVVTVTHKWSDYQLVWSEEFEGTSLNTNVWNVEVNGSGGGNNEKQYYTNRNENLRVKDGCLEIEVRKENYENREYTSGRINTKGKKSFAYGRIEARIALPSGKGTWPAFWMMGENYSQVGWPKCGEIDIMEHIGSQPTMVSFALHTTNKNGSKGNNWHGTTYIDNIEGQFHTYGIEWQKEEYNGCDKIIFTVDGKEYASSLEEFSNMDNDIYWPFNKNHFIILNMAIGGNMGGSIDNNIFQNDIIMKVDWVRVYQRTEIE